MRALAIVVMAVGGLGMLYALLLVLFAVLEWLIFWRPQIRRRRDK